MAHHYEQISTRVRHIRVGFVVLSGIFTLCVTLQVFIAGLALFVDSSSWHRHTTFVHFFEYLPVLMLLLAIFGQLPPKVRWQSLGLLGLIIFQYATAKVSGDFPLLRILGALHPVIALILFWYSISCFRQAWNKVFKPTRSST